MQKTVCSWQFNVRISTFQVLSVHALSENIVAFSCSAVPFKCLLD